MPWEKNYDETEVLEGAMYAFWRHGYTATSMGDLVAATGINRGSIYTAFSDKRNLFMRALRHYDKVYRVDYLRHFADQYEPRDAIIAVFDAAAERPRNPDAPRGCLLVNTALELCPHDPEIRRFVTRSLKQVEEFFFNRIEAGQKQGTINKTLDARTCAQALLGLFMGLRVLTRAKAQQSTINAVTAQARMMLA